MAIPAFCFEPLPCELIGCLPRSLTDEETAGLWSIFVAINSEWELFHTRDTKHPVADASNLRSTWLEFVSLRADSGDEPSYVGEYLNALEVLRTLTSGEEPEGIGSLLFVQSAPPDTRLRHAKRYVVDEFMTVMIIASGFKEFGGKNYSGFIGGSRFNRATNICKPVMFPERGSQR